MAFTTVVFGTVSDELITTGVQDIISGGITNNITVGYGGWQYVFSGGTANNSIVNSSGRQIVMSGGAANSTIVNDGGSLEIREGGTLSGKVTLDGGSVSVDSGANVNLTEICYELDHAENGDILVFAGTSGANVSNFSLNLDGTDNGTYVLLDGAGSGLNGKVFKVEYGSQEVDIAVGNSYTFTDGQNISLYLADSNTRLMAVFSTPPADVAPPTIPSGLTQIVTGSSVAFDWNASSDNGGSGVKQYQFQLDMQGDFLIPECDKSGIVDKKDNVINGFINGAYYWRVRVQDNAGNWSEWSTPASFAVTNGAVNDDITPPSVPAGLTVSRNGKNIGISWDACTDNKSGVKQYQVQFNDKNDFTKPKHTEDIGSNKIDEVNEGMPQGTFYWRVRAQDNAGNWSAWSAVSSLQNDLTPPSAPTNLTSIVTGNSVAADWADSKDTMTGIKNYEFQVDTHSDFKTPEDSEFIAESKNTGTDVPVGKYYWRVRAQDNAGNFSAWSKGASFIVTPKDNAANAWQTAKDIAIMDDWVGFNDPADCYKLVMANAGTVTLNLTGLSGDANLSLLDSKGKVLKTSANRGNASESIINYLLLSGTYYVNVVTTDNGRGTVNTNYALTHAEAYLPADKAGNTWQAATDISTLDNWVGFGDAADCYKLVMANAGTVTLNLTGLAGDANLSLLDSKGKALKTSANRGNASEAITDYALLGGTYYVNVAPADGGKGKDNTNYTLTHAEKYCPADKAANTWQTAKDISILDNWAGFGDAADCYKITMTGNGIMSLNLTGLTGDANLTLLDANGRTLKTSANRLLTNEAIAAELKAGTYYVNIAPVKGANNVAYTLTHAEKYCPPDTAGSSFATAREITSGTIHEWLGFGDREDYYKFVVQNNGSTAGGGLSGFSSNINLFIYNSSGRLIDSSTNSGLTQEYAASDAGTVEAGTYYIKVLLAGIAATDYDLNFNLSQPGSLRLFGASSPLTGSSAAALTGDSLKKSPGMLAS
ncbi:MAG: pre-peptidase C-terminal domain-containing protein [Victivallaceae bacterium]